MMDDCVNYELYNTNQNIMNDGGGTCLDDEDIEESTHTKISNSEKLMREFQDEKVSFLKSTLKE